MNRLEVLQNELLGALIGLAKASMHKARREETILLIADALCVENTDEILTEENRVQEIQAVLDNVRKIKLEIAPGCASCTAKCGNTDDFDISGINLESEAVKQAKMQILNGAKEIAGSISAALKNGLKDPDVEMFLHKALAVISYEMDEEDLLPIVNEIQKIRQKCEDYIRENCKDSRKAVLEQTIEGE